MMIDMILNIISSHIALLFVAIYFSGIAMLLKSMHTQDRQLRDQTAIIGALREHVAKSAKSQIVTHDQVEELRERCTKLLARQQRIETRAPDAGRIDLAIRMLKRGNSDSQALHDLGLSDGEAKLLVRLHGANVEPEHVVHKLTKPRHATPVHTTPKRQLMAAQGLALAQMLGS